MPESRISIRQRERIAKRAGDCCEYCQSQARFAIDPLSIEHIIPRSRGGNNRPDNLALACQGCNNHKYNKVKGKDPVSGKTVRLYHPRKERWEEHFAWNDDFTLIIEATPNGRATVELLHLNREGLVNLRQVLYAMGEHPPAK